jgi:hypothetical protein
MSEVTQQIDRSMDSTLTLAAKSAAPRLPPQDPPSSRSQSLRPLAARVMASLGVPFPDCMIYDIRCRVL